MRFRLPVQQFSSFVKKSIHYAYILLCDEKKLVTVIVGLFSFKEKGADEKRPKTSSLVGRNSKDDPKNPSWIGRKLSTKQ